MHLYFLVEQWKYINDLCCSLHFVVLSFISLCFSDIIHCCAKCCKRTNDDKSILSANIMFLQLGCVYSLEDLKHIWNIFYNSKIWALCDREILKTSAKAQIWRSLGTHFKRTLYVCILHIISSKVELSCCITHVGYLVLWMLKSIQF